MPREKAISFSYAIVSFVADAARDFSIPVGVVLWSPESHYLGMRLVGEKEKLKGLDPHEDLPLVHLVQSQIQKWMETGKLPHALERIPPYDDRWWRHVRELLVHRVKLSEPRPIDCHEPDQELEPLYEALVGPHRPAREHRARIDCEITKCLKHLAGEFKARELIPGFKGRDVQVMRAFRGKRGVVVIEGINLATSQAELHSDATASKLMRLRDGLKGKTCELMIGYVASPEGLNGEGILIDWLRERTGAKTFDLMKDRKEFLAAVNESVTKVSR